WMRDGKGASFKAIAAAIAETGDEDDSRLSRRGQAPADVRPQCRLLARSTRTRLFPPPVSARADAKRDSGDSADWQARSNHLGRRLDIVRSRRAYESLHRRYRRRHDRR